MQAHSNDDMKMARLAILCFIESLLLGKENRNHINETNVLLEWSIFVVTYINDREDSLYNVCDIT